MSPKTVFQKRCSENSFPLFFGGGKNRFGKNRFWETSILENNRIFGQSFFLQSDFCNCKKKVVFFFAIRFFGNPRCRIMFFLQSPRFCNRFLQAQNFTIGFLLQSDFFAIGCFGSPRFCCRIFLQSDIFAIGFFGNLRFRNVFFCDAQDFAIGFFASPIFHNRIFLQSDFFAIVFFGNPRFCNMIFCPPKILQSDFLQSHPFFRFKKRFSKNGVPKTVFQKRAGHWSMLGHWADGWQLVHCRSLVNN